jgi:hypothetical protein
MDIVTISPSILYWDDTFSCNRIIEFKQEKIDITSSCINEVWQNVQNAQPTLHQMATISKN